MRWPWQRRKRLTDQTVVSWSGQTVAYVHARALAGEQFSIEHIGVERQGSDTPQEFVQRLQAAGLRGRDMRVLLRPEQYQFLQIDAPPVAPDELRAAARFQVRDLVHAHIDDITLDILKVGDGSHKGTASLFAVAATNAAIAEVMDLARAMQWNFSIIDVQETALRNLQSALAERSGRLQQADAALLIADERQALLTVSANEELFYARRIELPPGFLGMDWSSKADPDQALSGFLPVEEYVPGQDESNAQGAEHPAQRLLVEVQRSLDLWERTWSHLPLTGLQVHAGARTAELAEWLGLETGHQVGAMPIEQVFSSGLDQVAPADLAYCLPLLGLVLRS